MKIFIIVDPTFISSFERIIRSLDFFFSVEYLILSPIKIQFKEENNSNYIQFKSGKEIENYILKKFTLKLDHIFNFNVLHIYTEDFLKKIHYRAYNFHNSPLPLYRGVNSVNWGLFKNEKSWGVTWHKISSNVDSGDIIYQRTFDIPVNMYQVDLINYCFMLGIKSFKEIILKLYSNDISYISQLDYKVSSSYTISNLPEINLDSLEQFIFIERCQPITSFNKLRWPINLINNQCTLISRSKIFKGIIELKKSLVFRGTEIYYAD